jgi:predicted secreted hydrolase
MRNKWLALAAAFFLWQGGTGSQFKQALPGYRYEFPRDYFSHPEYGTEWWYYTGNVADAKGKRFGFELTFFRVGVDRSKEASAADGLADLFMAHLALSDLDGGGYYHAQRMNRPAWAGVDESHGQIWNGNWSVSWHGDDQELRGIDPRFSFLLLAHPEKPVVVHGEDGVSQKAAGAGHASHYFSFTRMKTTGTIELNGKSYVVSGLSWMDHEFFTQSLGPAQVGWDWFSVQLDDNTELMLYALRRADGSTDPYSSGTYVDAQGKARHLRFGEFTLTPKGERWSREGSAVKYPVEWEIAVPSLGLDLGLSTPLKQQEFFGDKQFATNYWEGAVELSGKRGGADIHGVGYLEMTGYDKPVRDGL